MDRWKARCLGLVGIGMLLLAAAWPRGSTAVTFADESMVHMINCTDASACQYSFFPNDITVPAGSGITFMNLSSATHTATSDTASFDTGKMPPGGIVRIEFDSPGTFLYHCTIHSTMRGRIVVTGTGPTATVPASPTPTSLPPSPTATASVVPSATAIPTSTAAPTATAEPKLTLSVRFVPKSVRRGQATQLRIQTLPAARLSIAVTSPGAPSMKRAAVAGVEGEYTLKVSTGPPGKAGTIVARVTARSAGRSMRREARAIVRYR